MRTKNSPDGRTFIEAARRAQVVEAACETIAAVGYAHASLARIAEHAGISKSVITYHFAGKDELFDEVVKHVMEDCEAYMRPHLDAAKNAAGRLEAQIRSELAYMDSHRAKFAALGEIIVNHRAVDGQPRFSDEIDETVTSELIELLRQGQRDGEFREFDPLVLAVTINQAIDGAFTLMATGELTDVDAYADELVTVFDLATRKQQRKGGRR